MPINPSNLPVWKNRSSAVMAKPASPTGFSSPGTSLPGASSPGAAVPGYSVPLAIANQETNGLLIWLLGFYTLACSIPLAEIVIIYGHVRLPFLPLADFLLTVGLLTTGRIGAYWKTPGAKAWVLTMVFFGLAALFGHYKTRSLSLVLPYLFRFHVFPFYVCAMVTNTKQVRGLLAWVGIGSFLLLGLVLKFGVFSDGRLLLPDTDLANPNDLGLGLLFALAAVVVFKSRIARLIGIASIPIFLLEIIRTGSRACTLTLVVLAIILFTIVSTRVRILMLLTIPILGVILVNSVSSFTLSRLTLIVSNPTKVQVEDDQLRGALDSQNARTELQKRAIELSLHNPVLGVGADMFADAVEEMVHEKTGAKSGWQGAHNTYLEVAAENGIPAMLCYTWTLLVTLYISIKCYRLCHKHPVLKDAAPQSLALILMSVVFVVCTAFSNNAYDPKVCVLVGLGAANYLMIRKELEAANLAGNVPGTPAIAVPGIFAGGVKSRSVMTAQQPR